MYKLQAMKNQMKGAAIACALALSLGFMGMASPAFADTVGGKTDVSLVANDSQISVTVPSEIPAYIQADGTLMFPTQSFITNNSAFAIHVSNIATSNYVKYKLVNEADFEAASDPNSLQMNIRPYDNNNGGSPAPVDVADYLGSGMAPTKAEWGMDAKDEGHYSIRLALAGKIKHVQNVPVTAETAYDITWTFAPGR